MPLNFLYQLIKRGFISNPFSIGAVDSKELRGYSLLGLNKESLEPLEKGGRFILRKQKSRKSGNTKNTEIILGVNDSRTKKSDSKYLMLTKDEAIFFAFWLAMFPSSSCFFKVAYPEAVLIQKQEKESVYLFNQVKQKNPSFFDLPFSFSSPSPQWLIFLENVLSNVSIKNPETFKKEAHEKVQEILDAQKKDKDIDEQLAFDGAMLKNIFLEKIESQEQLKDYISQLKYDSDKISNFKADYCRQYQKSHARPITRKNMRRRLDEEEQRLLYGYPEQPAELPDIHWRTVGQTIPIHRGINEEKAKITQVFEHSIAVELKLPDGRVFKIDLPDPPTASADASHKDVFDGG